MNPLNKIIDTVFTDKNIEKFGEKAFEAYNDRNLTALDKLRREDNISESGYIGLSVINGIFESDKLAQQNYAKTLDFLNELASNVLKNQQEFRNNVIRINDERTKILDQFTQSTDKNLEKARAEIQDIFKKAFNKFLEIDEPNEAQEKQFDRLERYSDKQLDRIEKLYSNAFKSCSDAIIANKIDDQMVNNAIEADKQIMKSLFSTMRSMGKRQATTQQMMMNTVAKVVDKITGNKEEATDEQMEKRINDLKGDDKSKSVLTKAGMHSVKSMPDAPKHDPATSASSSQQASNDNAAKASM